MWQPWYAVRERRDGPSAPQAWHHGMLPPEGTLPTRVASPVAGSRRSMQSWLKACAETENWRVKEEEKA